MATVADINNQKNRYKNAGGILARGTGILAIDSNKHDTEFLPVTCRGFRVNGAGTVKFTTYDETGALVDLTRVFAAGQVWDLSPVVRVWTTTTNATGIDGFI